MVSSLWAALGVPTTKVHILSLTTIVAYVLPPVVLYFVMAVLVITPNTRFLRLACWPVIVLLAVRASVSVDMALSHFERKFHNDLANPMLMIVTRSLYWAWTKEPLVRELRHANSIPSTLMDALDLALAFRGYGWNWSRGMYIPRDTRPSSRTGFASYVALSATLHGLMCGTLHRALRSFSPTGLGSTPGLSIFDDTLPWHLRYFRSSTISIIGCLATYSLLQTVYDIYTLLAVIFLRHDPALWPPGFDAPWCSTSLAQFWGRRWHQWLRHIFLVQGGYPLAFFFGRTGLIIGAFLSSAVYHYVGMKSLDSTTEAWRMLVGFGMMAPGMFAEQAFMRVTGKKVCGTVGWVWTMSWLLLWGNIIIDGFVRAGIYRSATIIDNVPFLRPLVERLVIDFDAWLHAAWCGDNMCH